VNVHQVLETRWLQTQWCGPQPNLDLRLHDCLGHNYLAGGTERKPQASLW
jgi:hypothetical protein